MTVVGLGPKLSLQRLRCLIVSQSLFYLCLPKQIVPYSLGPQTPAVPSSPPPTLGEIPSLAS